MATAAKRHAILMLTTLNSSALRKLRQKQTAFALWRRSVQEAHNFTVQLEVARLAREVETVKFSEEMLRTNF